MYHAVILFLASLSRPTLRLEYVFKAGFFIALKFLNLILCLSFVFFDR